VSNLKRIAKENVSVTAAAKEDSTAGSSITKIQPPSLANSPTSAVQALSTEEAGGGELTGKRKRSSSPEKRSTTDKMDIDLHIAHSFGDSYEQTTIDQISAAKEDSTAKTQPSEKPLSSNSTFLVPPPSV